MSTRNKKEERIYTLAEIKEKYFPNRDLASLRSKDFETTKESFLNIIKVKKNNHLQKKHHIESQ